MKILFVCTGNTCRSALAEGIARREAIERGLIDFEVGSAGTSAWNGAPASDGGLLVALEHGVDLSGHRARQLTREIVQENDVILVMGPHHLERAEALQPLVARAGRQESVAGTGGSRSRSPRADPRRRSPGGPEGPRAPRLPAPGS